eukprot:2372686-Pyramimonas_sp.AAC.1
MKAGGERGALFLQTKDSTPLDGWDKLTRASQIEGGSFSICGYRLSAAHTHLKHLPELYWFSWLAYQEWCFGT